MKNNLYYNNNYFLNKFEFNIYYKNEIVFKKVLNIYYNNNNKLKALFLFYYFLEYQNYYPD